MPALSSHQVTAVTNKVNRLLTLSRDAHGELDFRDFGNSRGQRSESKYTSNVGRTLPVVPSQYLSRVPLGHPTPYLQERQSIQVPTNKCNQEESLSMVHLRWFDRVTSVQIGRAHV